MPTEGTDFHGRDGFNAFSSHPPSSKIGNSSNAFMFCVFRGPLFRHLDRFSKRMSEIIGERGGYWAIADARMRLPMRPPRRRESDRHLKGIGMPTEGTDFHGR